MVLTQARLSTHAFYSETAIPAFGVMNDTGQVQVRSIKIRELRRGTASKLA